MADDNVNDQQAEDADEQSEDVESTDQAGGDSAGVDADGADATAEEEAEVDASADDADSDDLDAPIISDAKFDALKGDPDKLLREMNRAATKKFQRLSAARQAVEPYADFIKSYEQDPRGAVALLAEQLGIKVKEPEGRGAEAAVENLAARVNARVKEMLGPEYEDISDRLGAAVYEAARMVATEAIKPLKADQDQIISSTAQREAGDVITAFAKKYPDWQKHEKEMMRISQKLPASGNIKPIEYMEMVYHLATRDANKGEALKEAAKRMNASAKRGSRDRTVSDKTVSKTPGRLPSFAEAAAAAERGERFE